MGTDETRKHVYVQDATIGAARPLNAAQAKMYHKPEIIAHAMVHVPLFARIGLIRLDQRILSGDPYV